VAKPTFAKDRGKNEPAVDLAQPQTVAARAVEIVRPHTTKLLAVLAGLVVVIVGLTIYTTMSNRGAARSTHELSRLIAETQAKVEEAGPEITLVDGTGAPSTTPARYKTFAERSAAALDLRGKLDLGSKIGGHASIVEAGLLYDAGKYDEAIAAYRSFLGGEHEPFLAGQAREGIGYALEAKALAQTDAAARNGGLDEALRAFSEIAAGEKEPLYPVALYHQARIKALKGEKPAAIELYKKALEHGPAPHLSDEINNRLALLEPK
jgi:tetratricopeptide (TPR) repeat protein